MRKSVYTLCDDKGTGQTAWMRQFESSLVTIPKDWFSRDKAHFRESQTSYWESETLYQSRENSETSRKALRQEDFQENPETGRHPGETLIRPGKP